MWVGELSRETGVAMSCAWESS
uniref:Uncharacterized protein n=1 Tax=Arundo donax TaxID=35708 RepID=A0A0A9G1T3_ARUDO